ncbi:MAG: aminoacyl-tRNA hydrolase, partial [Candidatus Woesearchaeota archaeon]
MPYKLVVVVRKDLKLPKGKLAVQVAHAAVDAVLSSDKGIVDEWRSEGGKKIALW